MSNERLLTFWKWIDGAAPLAESVRCRISIVEAAFKINTRNSLTHAAKLVGPAALGIRDAWLLQLRTSLAEEAKKRIRVCAPLVSLVFVRYYFPLYPLWLRLRCAPPFESFHIK